MPPLLCPIDELPLIHTPLPLQCVAVNPAWETMQTWGYLRGTPIGEVSYPPDEWEPFCASVDLTGEQPKDFPSICEAARFSDAEDVRCGHSFGKFWLQTGANNGLWSDQKQDLGYCCELNDPDAIPGYDRPTAWWGFTQNLEVYLDSVREPDDPYKIGMIMLGTYSISGVSALQQDSHLVSLCCPVPCRMGGCSGGGSS
jgi:hypothetical protein